MSYYKRQLEKLGRKDGFGPSFKFMSPTGDTNWMDLNPDSAEALREWLDEQFPQKNELVNLGDLTDEQLFQK